MDVSRDDVSVGNKTADIEAVLHTFSIATEEWEKREKAASWTHDIVINGCGRPIQHLS